MATFTLDPNATVIAARTVTGAASTHAALSDSSDSSYIDPGGTLTPIVELSGFTLGTSLTKTISITMRARKGGLADADVFARATSASANDSWTGQIGLPGAFVVDDETSPVVLPALTQTNIDDLRLTFTVIGPGDAEIAEAWVNIVAVAQPVVTVTAVTPDPYTASTIIPIEWSAVTDADGGSPDRYEIRVFDETTYGAGFSGLDVDNDAPYWQSGEVASSLTTADVGPLDSPDGYRVAVRVAQNVNGVKHWSDWDTDDFDLSVPTSDVSSVTVAAVDADGKIAVTANHAGATPDWELVEVERSIDGKTTWTPVRGATLADATGDLSSFVVDDFAVPNGAAADYRARATYYLTGQSVTGSWVEAASSTTWSSDDCWLKDPLDPTNNTTFKLGGREANTQNRRVGVFNVVGSRFPITVSDRRSAAIGVLPVWSDSAVESAAIESILEAAPTILVQFPPSMDIPDRYSVVTSDSELMPHPAADVVWRRWSVDYVQTAEPADTSVGAL